MGVPLDGLEKEPPAGRDEPRGLVWAVEPPLKSISNASPPLAVGIVLKTHTHFVNPILSRLNYCGRRGRAGAS